MLLNGYISTKDEIGLFGNGVTNLSDMINNEENIIHKSDCKTIYTDLELIKLILDFGWDINSVDNKGRTFFTRLLQKQSKKPFPWYRATQELAVFNNPDLSKHSSVISYGMKADLKLYETTLATIAFEATWGQNTATCDTKDCMKSLVDRSTPIWVILDMLWMGNCMETLVTMLKT